MREETAHRPLFFSLVETNRTLLCFVSWLNVVGTGSGKRLPLHVHTQSNIKNEIPKSHNKN